MLGLSLLVSQACGHRYVDSETFFNSEILGLRCFELRMLKILIDPDPDPDPGVGSLPSARGEGRSIRTLLVFGVASRKCMASELC